VEKELEGPRDRNLSSSCSESLQVTGRTNNKYSESFNISARDRLSIKSRKDSIGNANEGMDTLADP